MLYSCYPKSKIVSKFYFFHFKMTVMKGVNVLIYILFFLDIDECQGKFFCPTNTRCLNTIGSYVCEGTKCSHGFAYNESRQRCIDIDECNTGVLQCKENQVCKNLIGSAVCQCLPGFQLNDAIQCEDMDECSFSSNVRVYLYIFLSINKKNLRP